MKKYSQLFSSLLVVLLMLNVITPTFVYAAEVEENKVSTETAVEVLPEAEQPTVDVEKPTLPEKEEEVVKEEVVKEKEEQPTVQEEQPVKEEAPVVEEPKHPAEQTEAEMLEEVNEETEEVLEVRGAQAAGNQLTPTLSNFNIRGQQGSYYNGDPIGIGFDWAIPQGVTVQPGDYFTVSVPDFLQVPNQTLSMQHGTCELSNGQVTCTFDSTVTDYTNFSGKLEIGAQVKAEQGSGKQNKPIYVNGQHAGDITVDGGSDQGTIGPVDPNGPTGRDVGKWGSRSLEDPTIINWTLEANGDLSHDMITIIDTPQKGHKIIPGSVSIGIDGQIVQPGSPHVENYSVTEDQLNVQLRTYRLDYPIQKYKAVIYYQTKITDENVDAWVNDVTLSTPTGEVHHSSKVEKFGGAWSQAELEKHTGSFELVKKGPNAELLAGATFNLVNHKGEVVKTITTNEEGKAFVENIPGGHYTLVEVTAPEGFMKLENPVGMTLKFDQNQSHVQEVTNEYEPIEEKPVIPEEKPEEKFGSITLFKTDAADQEKVLEGAVFNLYKEDHTLVKENLVTDENGEITVKDLEEGKYYFKEVTAPEGYQLSTELHSVEIEEEAVVSINVENVQEEPLVTKGSVQLVKVDATDQEKVLEGAVFELKAEDGEVVASDLTTDENGQITVENLEEGTYYFHEVVAPEGYSIKEEPMKFEVTPGAVVKVEVENTPEEPVEETPEEPEKPTTPEPEEPEEPEVPEPEVTKASVKLVKVDAVDQEKVLEGAVFNLYNEAGEVVKENLTTNEAGIIEVTELEEGAYYFQEVKAPEGYTLDEAKVEFTAENNKEITLTVSNNKTPEPTKASVKLVKVDAADQEKVLEGAVFNLYNEAGEIVKENLTTNEAGIIEVTELEEGAYYFQEVKAPEGYTLDEVKVEFTAENNKEIAVTVSNNKTPEKPVTPEPTKASVKLVKVDAVDQEKVLEGAVFNLYNEAGEVVKENLTTNEAGIIEVTELEEGAYYFQEVKAPEGYTLDEVKVEFTAENNKEITLTVSNNKTPEPTKASVKLVKVDAVDQEKVLEGAVFNLYNEAGEVVKENLTTNEAGIIEVTELEEGAYYFQEVKAPEGYTLDEVKVEFTAENNKEITLTVSNNKTPEEPEKPTPPAPEEPVKKASVELMKVDAADGKKVLEGAVFNLYKADGTLVEENLMTNEAGIIKVTGLDEGAYYFQEVKAPTGYTLDDTKINFVTEKAQQVSLTVSNTQTPDEPGEETPEEPEKPTTPEPEEPEEPEVPEPETPKTSVKLVKVDARDHDKVLEGAIFNLYKADGTEIATDLTTNKEGIILVEDLEEGDYYFVEKRAPKGYKLNRDKHTFTIEKDKNVEITVENKKRPSGGGGGTPPPTETPEEPGEETPEEPETPETPEEETPEEPETPETPEGETPEEPETPETPEGETPEEPETPETPENETPTTPEVTTPDKPTTPGQPVVETPEKEEQPAKGNVLPQTGEAFNQFILFVAALLIMIGGIFTFRRTETK